jgi:phosphate/sulfate permease
MVVKLILSALLGFILCLLLIAVLANLKVKNKKNKLSAYRSRDMAVRNSEKNKNSHLRCAAYIEWHE